MVEETGNSGGGGTAVVVGVGANNGWRRRGFDLEVWDWIFVGLSILMVGYVVFV